MQESQLTGLSILVVDDEALLRKQIAAHFEKLGADVTTVGTIEGARNLLKDLSFDFAFVDVNLPDGTGFDLLQQKAFSNSTGVVIMTGNAQVAGAVDAMRLGALDYLVKPFDPGELPLVMNRARRAKQSARIEEHRKKSITGPDFFFGTALAASRAHLDKILAADRRVQGALPPVLVLGETGTGKTTIARMIHNQGPRANQPLVEMNCSALPDLLAESELFGHERGAFTDAHAARMGLFEAANGGTLFLDELPSLSLSSQSKVLTAIEERRIRRIGGNKEILVDVRIITATNRDLKQLVTEGKFREDLYHRLDLFRVPLPALRERSGDILELAEYLMKSLCARYRLPVKAITLEGKQRLLTYHWPGNVRELSHELERAIVFEDSPELSFDHLQSTPTQDDASVHSNPPLGGSAEGTPSAGDWFRYEFVFPETGFSLEAAINRLIHHALKQSGGNVSGAARRLGVTRDYVRYRLDGPKRTDEAESIPPEN